MSAIAATLDAARLRVGVNLSGWSTAGDAQVIRRHQDGSSYPVRSMSAVSGGVGFGWDYETPLSAPFTYEAKDGSATIVSPVVTLAVAHDVATLTVPTMPTFGGFVTPERKPERFDRKRPSVALDILGRSTDIVLSDAMKVPSFTLKLVTRTDAAAYLLLSMLAVAPVLLLRMPGARVVDWGYVATGDVAEIPITGYKDAGSGDGEWTRWEIQCQVDERPEGDTFGDPTSTWQALKDSGLTWQQMKDSGLTWLEVLRGDWNTT